jgi:hypothetical protein
MNHPLSAGPSRRAYGVRGSAGEVMNISFYRYLSLDAYVAGEPCILLQCRVDDAAFMEAMNIGSSFVNDDIVEEEEYEDVNEEGEGLIEPVSRQTTP